MKILLVGHAISPGRGSEPGFTWNWGRMLARKHHVWVLAQPEFKDDVDAALLREPIPNLHIEWIDLPRSIDPWHISGGRMGIGLHYLVWQELAFRKAVKLHAEIRFDFVHHVSLGTVSAPPKLWKLGIPFVWGPIGGGQISPPSFSAYFRGERIREWLRGIRIRSLPFTPAFRKAAQRSALILVTNYETVTLLQRAGAQTIQCSLDGALPSDYILPNPIGREASNQITLLWAGSLLPRKGLPLALEALTQVDSKIQLVVAGDGRKRRELEEQATHLKLGSRVRFLGKLSWEELRDVYRQADGFVFTSLRDTFGTVILEAMAHSLPVIALNHQGVAMHVPDNAALKVAVTTPAETIRNLAASMTLLSSSAALRAQIGQAGWEFAQQNGWEHRAVIFERLIRHLVFGNGAHEDGIAHDLKQLKNPSESQAI